MNKTSFSIVFRFVVFCAIGLSLFGRPANATPRAVPAELRVEVSDAIHEVIGALLTGDRAAWERRLAPNILLVDRDGSLQDRPALMADMRPLPPHVWLAFDIEELDIRPLGDVAVSTYRLRELEFFHDQFFEVFYRTTMIWKRGQSGWILEHWHYVEIPRDPDPMERSRGDLTAFVGTYSVAGVVLYEVTERDGRLFGGRRGQPAAELIPEADGVFASPGSEFRKVFVRAEDGCVVGILDRRKGSDLRWTRID